MKMKYLNSIMNLHSTMDQIKQKKDFVYGTFYCNLHSTMDQIKSESGTVTAECTEAFTFHYGLD